MPDKQTVLAVIDEFIVENLDRGDYRYRRALILGLSITTASPTELSPHLCTLYLAAIPVLVGADHADYLTDLTRVISYLNSVEGKVALTRAAAGNCDPT